MTIERTLRIYERCQSLPEAWTHIMCCLDEISEPNITITPVWLPADSRTAVYDVVVQGAPILDETEPPDKETS
jgi:hypothetical protein